MTLVTPELLSDAIDTRLDMIRDEAFSVVPALGRVVVFSSSGRALPLGDGYKTAMEMQVSVMRELADRVANEESSTRPYPVEVEIMKSTTRRAVQNALTDPEVSDLIFVNNGGVNEILTDDRIGNRSLDAFDLLKMADHVKLGGVYQVGPWFVPGYDLGAKHGVLPYGTFLPRELPMLRATYSGISPDTEDWRSQYGLKPVYGATDESLIDQIEGLSRFFGDPGSTEYMLSGQADIWVNYAYQKRGYPYAWRPGL